MEREGQMVSRKICKNCEWCQYWRAGIWLCVREGKKLSEGVLEVSPLWKGCMYWREKKEGAGVRYGG